MTTLEAPAKRAAQGALTREDSLALKGIAILMMLWHHCFSYGCFEVGKVSLWPFSVEQMVHIADYFGTCVCLFAFVSGYGLYLSCRRAQETGERASGWIWGRLVRTLSGYWFVVVLAWVVCGAVSGMPGERYGFAASPVAGICNMAMDFLGLNNFTGTPTLNGDWWYISTAVILIVLAPLLYGALEKYGFVFTAVVIVILQRLGFGHNNGALFLTYIPIFVFGMAFAKYGLPPAPTQAADARTGRGLARTVVWFVGSLALLLVTYKASFWVPKDVWWEVKRSVFPLALIAFSWMFVIRVPLVRKGLIFLGRHSLNIWLVHRFIRGDYGGGLIYGMPHFLVSIAALLAISVGISLALEFLKDKMGYRRWMERLAALPER